MGADNTFGETNFNPQKKYFAKYFPVEGKITDPEMVMFKIDGKWTEPCEFDSFVGNEIEEVKQGKLFLCSRDIQIGDKLIDIDNFEHEVTPIRFELLDKEDGYMRKRVFKVIGEISPNASWVKEGDEFEESEIKKVYRKKFECSCGEKEDCPYLIKDYRRGDLCIRQINLLWYIELKGPCGHFH